MNYQIGDIVEAVGNPDIKKMVLAQNGDIVFTVPVHDAPGASWLVTQESARKMAQEYWVKKPRSQKPKRA